MADTLHELLVPYLDHGDHHHTTPNPAYLAHLTTLALAALTSSEPQSLAQSAQSSLRALQALAKRSHKPIIASTDHLCHLRPALAHLAHHAAHAHAELPALDSAAHAFAQKYSRTADHAVLDRRRKAMLLARNVDRVADVLDLPTLLSSAIASSASTPAIHASALDLHAHIRRLHTLYPNAPLVTSLAAQAEHEMKAMTTNLIASLQYPAIKLAAAIRTIGWLRRVAPELDEAAAAATTKQSSLGTGEGTLGALFLVSRLAALESTLAALDPLRELADHETEKRHTHVPTDHTSGQQTEKYLKKYLEMFREQSFAIISMYKSIFPSSLPPPGSEEPSTVDSRPKSTHTVTTNALQPLPPALATFAPHLIDILFTTLRTYLPNIHDRSARDSLLTQLLYAAGSLGRLGGDFSMMIAVLEDDLRAQMAPDESGDDEDEEWVQVMKKHRIQASRLELLASGVGAGRTTGVVG